MKQYFIIKDEKHEGPFSLNEIIKLNLSENTLVWTKSLENWVELKDLSDYKKHIPPPIPTPKQSIINNNTKEEKNIELDNDQENFNEEPIKINPFNSATYNHAGFWLRLIAFVIDFIILFFITSFFWAILQIPIPSDSISLYSGRFFLFNNPVGLLINLLFYVNFESSPFQATPGKAIIGLKVTNERGDKIGVGRAVGRFFGKFFSCLIFGIGFLMIFFTKNKQGFHDIAANTYVLKGNVNYVKRRSASWIILSSAFVLFIFSLFIPANTKLLDYTNSSVNIPSEWENTVRNFNKQCPIIVDEETQLDNIIILKNKIVQFNYSLINISKSDLDITIAIDVMEPIVINNVKSNPELKIFRDNEISLNFYYNDMNGVFAFNILVCPDKYNID